MVLRLHRANRRRSASCGLFVLRACCLCLVPPALLSFCGCLLSVCWLRLCVMPQRAARPGGRAVLANTNSQYTRKILWVGTPNQWLKTNGFCLRTQTNGFPKMAIFPGKFETNGLKPMVGNHWLGNSAQNQWFLCSEKVKKSCLGHHETIGFKLKNIAWRGENQWF